MYGTLCTPFLFDLPTKCSYGTCCNKNYFLFNLIDNQLTLRKLISNIWHQLILCQLLPKLHGDVF
jgi:hypothetical protein